MSPAAPGGTVEVWRQDDGAWRWRWVSPDGATTLVSHRSFDEREEAVESAQEAYPGLPVPEPEPAAPRRRRVRRLAVAAAVVMAVAVVVRHRAGRPASAGHDVPRRR
ncbi:hypothetical protein [Nocardioides sp. KR10-350]|uniref:hypothetical protein n=1 Tax=Nocardioides cheoyonin TaxID=3156615 RepID=UPI0032B4197C